MKWWLNFMSCNFGLKSYFYWFQIELAQRAHLILKSHVRFQITLHTVQLALPTRWIGHIINHVGLLSRMCTTIFSFCTCKKVVHLCINFAVLSHGSRGSSCCLGCQARYCPMCNLPGWKQDQEKRTHGMCPQGKLIYNMAFVIHVVKVAKWFPVAMHMFSNRSQMTSKCGKNKKE